ncbi:MAG: HDOD domain-containing protein [Pseudomonadota bacterium]
MNFPSQHSPLTIDDLLQGDHQLASPPEVYARLSRLLEQPDTSLDMLGSVIEHDPALSARLLRLANSAFFALPGQVESISEAVSIVGIRELRDLVLTTEVIQRFDNVPEDLMDIYSFWRSSLRCAVLSRQLGTLLPQRRQAESLFLAGLLHDIGHLVIYSKLPEAGRKALLEHRHRKIPLEQAERTILGFDYAQVGAALARQWALPEQLISTIGNHPHPQQAERFKQEALLVHLARRLSQLQSFDPARAAGLLKEEAPLWQQAGLETTQLSALLVEAEQAYGASLALLR